MDCHGWHHVSPDLPPISRNGPEKPSTASKRLLQSLQRRLDFFLHLFVFLFSHVLGMFVSGISCVLQSYSQFCHDIIIRDTTLYTIVFTDQPALDLRLRPKEARRFAKPAMTWTHSENVHGFLGAVDLEAGSKWNKILVGGLEHFSYFSFS